MKKIFIAVGLLLLVAIISISFGYSGNLFSGALRNIFQPQKNPVFIKNEIQNITPVYKISSSFFTGDQRVQDVLNGKSYDMDSMQYAIGIPGKTLNKKEFGYKIMSALKMLGYNTSQGNLVSGGKPHILVINQFQKRNGLTVFNFVDASFIEHLDGQVGLKEKEEMKYKDLFPLYNTIQRDENDVSKEHIAKIYSMVYQVLPKALALSTAESYKACFLIQCGIDFYNKAANTFTNLKIFDVSAFLMNDTVELKDYVHEYGHYIDGLLFSKDSAYPKRGMIDTRGFYSISFNDDGNVHLKPNPDNGVPNCFQKKTGDPYEFITDYAASPSAFDTCPQGWNRYAEDFAESFSSYILQGENFRDAAKVNGKIKGKYDWLKNNVFEGIEYNTDLMAASASGCNDIPLLSGNKPGYLKCQEDYVWDGEIKKLVFRYVFFIPQIL
ncbi:hypothetical protein KKA13_03230 [Patescibacteria group bacterium]|nr:hypothetical protein [Patescibacteria group bacterium]